MKFGIWQIYEISMMRLNFDENRKFEILNPKIQNFQFRQI